MSETETWDIRKRNGKEENWFTVVCLPLFLLSDSLTHTRTHTNMQSCEAAAGPASCLY